MMPRGPILLLGKNGQLGWELQRALAPLDDVLALGRQGAAATAVAGDNARGAALCGDLGDAAQLAATVRAVRPAVIVNAAAYTAVDKAESQADLAWRVNAEAPAALAREAAALGAWLVHYSSDYVFDGSGQRPWQEGDATGPLSVYGRTKLAGEQAIQASGCQHLIFRTSWVHAARGGNFIRTMLRLGREKERLQVIADQYGAPTGAELIADVTAHALRRARANPALGGIYHLAAAGETNWHAYARHIFAQARALALPLAVRDVQPVCAAAYPASARRPANSRLATGKLQAAFDLRLPHWQSGVDRTLAEILALTSDGGGGSSQPNP
ncbi:MAG: dTDP-4-dehydrorhamnose reductase [Burkholderiaceae bacterium]|jgi:dTDP-4-dehydrorhamnose reductase|nr:dTDP-4-dehydrorhamnose reductase [Burkholderiaceae bacterium]